MEQSIKKEQSTRSRRRTNGMAITAGVSKVPAQEHICRSVSLLRAALRLWEAKHGYVQTSSAWQRRPRAQAE